MLGHSAARRETDDSSFMRGNERKYWSPSSCPPPMAEREEGHPHAIIPSDRGEVGRQTDRSHTQRERRREIFLIVNMNEASRISEAVLATAPEPAPVLPRIGTSWRLTFPARARVDRSSIRHWVSENPTCPSSVQGWRVYKTTYR